MVSLRGADQAVGVDMLVLPALVTLLLKQAASLNVIVFPTVLVGAFKLPEGDRGGISLGGRAPAVVSGALRGNKGDSRTGVIRGQGLGRVKEEVVNVGVDTGSE